MDPTNTLLLSVSMLITNPPLQDFPSPDNAKRLTYQVDERVMVQIVKDGATNWHVVTNITLFYYQELYFQTCSWQKAHTTLPIIVNPYSSSRYFPPNRNLPPLPLPTNPMP